MRGIPPDVTPNAVNWADMSATSDFTVIGENGNQTISGIDINISLRVSWSGTPLTYVSIIVNGSSSFITNGSTKTVSPGDTVRFQAGYGSIGTAIGTFTITNASDGEAVLDTFNYSLTNTG